MTVLASNLQTNAAKVYLSCLCISSIWCSWIHLRTMSCCWTSVRPGFPVSLCWAESRYFEPDDHVAMGTNASQQGLGLGTAAVRPSIANPLWCRSGASPAGWPCCQGSKVSLQLLLECLRGTETGGSTMLHLLKFDALG